jgi:hypothetical protein
MTFTSRQLRESRKLISEIRRENPSVKSTAAVYGFMKGAAVYAPLSYSVRIRRALPVVEEEFYKGRSLPKYRDIRKDRDWLGPIGGRWQKTGKSVVRK